MIPYPNINPVALHIGPLSIHWYGLAYVAGFLVFLSLAKRLSRQWRFPLSVEEIDALSVSLILGVIIGGRLGEVLFYHPDYYLRAPLEILKVWRGGMSFHGGMLGAITAMVLFARRLNLSPWVVLDAVAPLVPPGLFFGRLANFINAELVGRPTDVPWAMIFPGSDGQARHPSQLYEACLEGIVLFVVVYGVAVWRLTPTPPDTLATASTPPAKNQAEKKNKKEKRTTKQAQEKTALSASQPSPTHPRQINNRLPLGRVSGLFLIGYGLARFMVEWTRTPDTFMGYYPLGLSMGQFLCLPMLGFGLYLILRRPRQQY